MNNFVIFLSILSICLCLQVQVQVDEADLVDKNELNRLFKINYDGQVYSGYLKANNEGTAQFHYMFYPAPVDSLKKPVILWLNGGPGCSSLQGAFNENGPFVFKAGTAEFEMNQYSWTNFANMLYIESPITVGFSYGPQGDQSDESTAKYNINALIDFFSRFTEYKKLPFFISGESYAGIYIPTLANEIIDYNVGKPTDSLINLQGLAIGNGCTDPTECTDQADPFQIHVYKFYGRHNFISEELYEKILAVQNECYGVKDGKCKELADKVEVEVSGTKAAHIKFNPYNIYGYCFTYTPEGSKMSQKFSGMRSLNDESDVPPCADVQGLYHYLKSAEIRTLLKIRQESAEWSICSRTLGNYQVNPKGSYYLYQKIIKNQIRILKFSGDVDAVVPLTGTMFWIDKLQKELYLATLKPWRPWFIHAQREVDPDQNAGYVMDLDGLTLLTIRNAGHMVPLDKREESEIFMQKFIKGELFP
ncbi:unnamed protein product [Paramecium primaurelia]|uniref:Carboxypeptidase n=1 Tax=Paramecium primaurelia TaxID=5886 RepID=A0A8S1Q1J9_PARPR|nr:unnamed protein product [Paramecium primaurelia]